jgi:hypothetical protein
LDMGTLVGLRVPPPKDEEEFEDITCAAARLRWPGSDFERNGTRGQRQDGVDIVGHDDMDRLTGIQCRNLDKRPTLQMVMKAVEDAEAFKSPGTGARLEVFYYACPTKRDSKLQAEVRRISWERKKAGRFTVGLLFWPDIWNDLALDPRQVAKFFPQFVAFDSLPDGIRPGVQEKLQDKIWMARYQALQDMGSLVSGLLDGVPSHIDDWGDACEFIAMDFGSIERSLQRLLRQYGDQLSGDVRELLGSAHSICREGQREVSFEDGVPEVSGKGRDLAGQLYDRLEAARQQSLMQINKAAGMK